jgi:4-amino-4-deoxy-L-arabinose transferase-like glycosyltransferase
MPGYTKLSRQPLATAVIRVIRGEVFSRATGRRVFKEDDHAGSRLVAALFVGILIGVGAIRIAATYSVFNHTNDEPAHIASGMEWLDRGSYTLEPQHPPLARVAVAIGPYLDGARSMGGDKLFEEGRRILYGRHQYARTLTLARLGVLPFFIAATYIVWYWSRRLFGTTAALVSAAIFTNLPPVLAHGGLATTDMPLTATLLGALLAFCLWVENPSLIRSAVLGVAIALAILSKFSALLFLPACALVAVALWLVSGRPRADALNQSRRIWGLSILVAAAFTVLWAGYRFSLSTLTTAAIRPHAEIDRYVGASGVLHDFAYFLAETIPLPARELVQGIGAVKAHNDQGHWAYLFGRISETGWWYYFPVALLVKSPLPFLILIGVAVVWMLPFAGGRQLVWSQRVPLLAAMSILLVCLPSNINIGIRHILPMYPLLSMVAGYGAACLWHSKQAPLIARATAAGLLLWLFASCVRIHPDYLSYFNELVGRHPEQVLLDSDVDWGQDLLRLARFVRVHEVENLALAYLGTADPTQHGFRVIRPLGPYQPTEGWVAISLMCLKGVPTGAPHDQFAWLNAYRPVAVIGRSINVYYVRGSIGLVASHTSLHSDTPFNCATYSK